MHKSGRVSALKKVINQQERWTYTLNINYRPDKCYNKLVQGRDVVQR